MSGHSKWANIKHKKEIEDKKRGTVFSGLSKQIMASIKEGGGSDPEMNPKLRAVIKKAREANMPRNNIDRAIKSFEKKAFQAEELLLEGYAEGGVGVIIETLTNSRNRTLSELKFIFKTCGGNLAESGAVLFQFERLRKLLIEGLTEEEALDFLDYGVVDLKAVDKKKKEFEFWVKPGKASKILIKLKKNPKLKVLVDELVFRAKDTLGDYKDPAFSRVRELLEKLLSHEDVVSVYCNLKNKE